MQLKEATSRFAAKMAKVLDHKCISGNNFDAWYGSTAASRIFVITIKKKIAGRVLFIYFLN